MPKPKSIPKAQAVETINAGGTVREGVTIQTFQGNRELVPVLRLHDKESREVGIITKAVFAQLLGKSFIRRSADHPGAVVYVRAAS